MEETVEGVLDAMKGAASVWESRKDRPTTEGALAKNVRGFAERLEAALERDRARRHTP